MDAKTSTSGSSFLDTAPGLFDIPVSLKLPKRLVVEGKIGGNPIRGFAYGSHTRTVTLMPHSRRGVVGHLATDQAGRSVFLSPRRTAAKMPFEGVLQIPDADTPAKVGEAARQANATWQMPRAINIAKESIEVSEARCKAIVESWAGKFEFRQEKLRADGTRERGLRRPQIGALYAALAHWSVSDAPATIVMPTGTGKTETMLALTVCSQLHRVLVVVPNNALREQIGAKFVSLGKLAECGCVPGDVALPVVALLKHRPLNPTEVDDVFRRANVVVTTMQIAGQSSPEVQARMAELCSHLVIDEAHHIAAKTWSEFKRQFDAKPVLQFTATPFRTDGKRVDGKFIYSYPLKRAQDEGYFKPIKFAPVTEFDEREADRAIARRAGNQLHDDIKGGFDHVLMARVDTTARADALLEVYQEEFAEFAPVVIHSGVPSAIRQERLDDLRARRSRLVVCVDMFGEGFDFPELKVAALHDRHKSLAITLQFIGRFTRDLSTVGDATVVANIADDGISGALRSLYAEDADWNFLLKVLSEATTERAKKRAEILEGFTDALPEIPLQVLAPKMSAVVYRTTCDTWEPMKVQDLIPAARLYAGPIVNPAANLAIFVTRDEEQVRWGAVKQVQNVEWNLYVLHWNEELGLLFINSSNKDFHEAIANAVAGAQDRIQGDAIFRSLGHIKRLTLTNLGLSHAFGKNIRYTMFMGADIAEGLSEAQKFNRRKSNLFGLGYEEDEKVTIGCSFKGRLWSHRVAYDLSEWTDWCAHVGMKLLDDQISIEDVLSHLIKARTVTARPALVPIMVAWPEDFLDVSEEQVELEIGAARAPFYECETEVTNYTDTGPLTFDVVVSGQRATFEVTIDAERAEFKQLTGSPAFVAIRRRRKPLSDYFNQDPPIIHFANGDFLVFNELFELPRGAERAAFDATKVSQWDWTGIDLRKESQGDGKDRTSIQRRVIDRLIAGELGDYDIVFDDDGSGEVADVVALKLSGRKLTVSLFHCKYSGAAEPGARIDDLYAVCGQAQKCVQWREDPRRLLRHLMHRETLRQTNGRVSRIEKGTRSDIQRLINQSRELSFSYDVAIVQPGLSKAKLSAAALDVLGATELFLLDTYSIPLRIVSAA